jgi:hypothetical protein
MINTLHVECIENMEQVLGAYPPSSILEKKYPAPVMFGIVPPMFGSTKSASKTDVGRLISIPCWETIGVFVVAPTWLTFFCSALPIIGSIALAVSNDW